MGTKITWFIVGAVIALIVGYLIWGLQAGEVAGKKVERRMPDGSRIVTLDCSYNELESKCECQVIQTIVGQIGYPEPPKTLAEFESQMPQGQCEILGE